MGPEDGEKQKPCHYGTSNSLILLANGTKSQRRGNDDVGREKVREKLDGLPRQLEPQPKIVVTISFKQLVELG
jgi:hypothetical protein